MQNIFSNKKHCFANKFNIITNSSAVNISICFILTVFLFLGIAIYCNTRISGLCLNNESTNTITDNYNISLIYIYYDNIILSYILIADLNNLKHINNTSLDIINRCLKTFHQAVNDIAATTDYPYSVATGYGAIDESGIDNCFKAVDSIMYKNKIKSKKSRDNQTLSDG